MSAEADLRDITEVGVRDGRMALKSAFNTREPESLQHNSMKFEPIKRPRTTNRITLGMPREPIALP